MTERSVSVGLSLRVADYVAGLRTAATQTKAFSDELGKSHTASKKLSDGMLVTGGALAGGFLLAAKAAADFDQQMSHVNAVTNGSAAELQGLRTAALAAGKDTQYSATQAAQAEEELAKAGIKTADIIGGGLTGSLNLAAAGSVDLAEAADIAAKAMNTFGLSGKDVPHIADVLAAAANKSATDVGELGAALKQGGLAARNSGLSLEDTTGVLAAFADRALVGSDAGTSMKTMLQALAAPTAKAQGEMQRLGISAYDAQGNFVGVSRFAGILQDKLGTLTQQQRNAALATIFGSDAMRAATVLYENGSDGISKYINAVNDSGAASEAARKKTDNLAGDLERLKGSLETVAIQAGSGTNSGLRTLTQTAGGLVDAFGSLPGPLQTTVTILAGISGVGLLAAGGLLKVRTTVKETLDALTAMGPAGAKAAGALSSVGSFAGKLGLAGAAVGVVWLGLDQLSKWAASKSAPVKSDIDALTQSIKQFAETGKAVGELADKYGQSLEKIGQDAKGVADGMKAVKDIQAQALTGVADMPDLTQGLVDPQQVQRIQDLDSALAKLVSSGGATQAKLFLDDLRSSGKLTSEQYQDLINLMPQYSAAAAGAATANSGMAKGFGDATQNAFTLQQGLGELLATGQSLIDIFNQLNGAQLNVNETAIAAEAAADNLTESLKKNGKSLDLNTEAGRANQSAFDALARKAAEAAQAVLDNGGSAAEATAVFGKYRDQMVKAYMAMGKSKEESEALADSLMALPKDVPITVTTYFKTSGTTFAKEAATGAITRRTGSSRLGGRQEASGGVLDFYASGGLNDPAHVAQIAPAGSWRVWGEPETGGEGYIPLAESKRARSVSVLAEINRRFGNPLGGGMGQTVVAQSAAPNVQVFVGDEEITSRVRVVVQQEQQKTARAVASGVRR